MAEQPSPRKDGLALIVAGVFVLTLVFLSYRYFNASTQVNQTEEPTQVTVVTSQEDENSRLDKLKDLISRQFQGNENEQITDEAASDEISNDGEIEIDTDAFIANRNQENMSDESTPTSPTTISASGTTNMDKTMTSGDKWVANDYSKGDIQGSTYTVKSGDTLWEIAEAVSGNGANWTQILAANSANIGQLPSGQQALITVGQTLVIPQLN